MNHIIFAYGTLKKGFSNHDILKRSKFIGTGFTTEKYSMYQDGIPYVVKEEAVSNIQGEVYSVDSDILKILDRLERHPDWYCRKQVDVRMDSTGEVIIAWLYFNPTPEGELVESGCYTV